MLPLKNRYSRIFRNAQPAAGQLPAPAILRQPELDWSNPITHGLVAAVLPPFPVNLVNGKFCAPVSGSNRIPTTSGDGGRNAWDISTARYSSDFVLGDYDSMDTMYLAESAALFINYRINTAGANYNLVKLNQGYGNPFMMIWAAGNLSRWRLSNTDGSVSKDINIDFNQGAFDADLSHSKGWVVSTVSQNFATLLGRDIYQRADGSGPATATIALNAAATQLMAVPDVAGSPAKFVLTASASAKDVGLAMLWNREPEAAELYSLYADYGQIFKSSVHRVYFLPSAAAAPTTRIRRRPQMVGYI